MENLFLETASKNLTSLIYNFPNVLIDLVKMTSSRVDYVAWVSNLMPICTYKSHIFLKIKKIKPFLSSVILPENGLESIIVKWLISSLSLRILDRMGSPFSAASSTISCMSFQSIWLAMAVRKMFKAFSTISLFSSINSPQCLSLACSHSCYITEVEQGFKFSC